MPMRVGLYGGTFDPVHCGHLIVARAVLEQASLDRILFLPSASPPHKQVVDLLACEHRAEMVRLAIADEPGLEFSDFDLTRKGPSYTIDTVLHFHRTLGEDVALHWIIGADSLAELMTWHRVSELVDACRIVTAGRVGWDRESWGALRRELDDAQVQRLEADVLDTPVIQISSSEIRDRIRRGLSVRFSIPDAVLAYIDAHGLYRL